MNVHLHTVEWRRPGCGQGCVPRRCDPVAHEGFGFLLALQIQAPRIVRTGPLVIDLYSERVTVSGVEARLSGREWGLLAYLARNIGRPCPVDEIMAAAWGPEWVTPMLQRLRSVDRGYYRVDHAHLSTVCCRLRSKLGAAGRLVTASNGGGIHSWRRLELEAPDEP